MIYLPLDMVIIGKRFPNSALGFVAIHELLLLGAREQDCALGVREFLLLPTI